VAGGGGVRGREGGRETVRARSYIRAVCVARPEETCRWEKGGGGRRVEEARSLKVPMEKGSSGGTPHKQRDTWP
jgi:hypothetical protein